MGQGIVDAIRVVLGRDHGQFGTAVAVALEVMRRDLAEDAGEPAFDLILFSSAGGAEQDDADLLVRHGGHLLGPEHESDASAAALDEVERRMEGGRAGRAGVLGADGRHVFQARNRCADQSGLETLLGKAAVHHADGRELHIVGRHARMVERRRADQRQQVFDVGRVELAEGRMGPADDSRLGRHGTILRRREPCDATNRGGRPRAAKIPRRAPDRHRGSTRRRVTFRARFTVPSFVAGSLSETMHQAGSMTWTTKGWRCRDETS